MNHVAVEATSANAEPRFIVRNGGESLSRLVSLAAFPVGEITVNDLLERFKIHPDNSPLDTFGELAENSRTGHTWG